MSRASADVGEAQEIEGLRSAEPALLAPVRRLATELDQASLLRMKRQCELLEPLAHPVPEAPGVGLMFEAHDDVVGIAHNHHSARGLVPSPALGPQIEDVV